MHLHNVLKTATVFSTQFIITIIIFAVITSILCYNNGRRRLLNVYSSQEGFTAQRVRRLLYRFFFCEQKFIIIPFCLASAPKVHRDHNTQEYLCCGDNANPPPHTHTHTHTFTTRLSNTPSLKAGNSACEADTWSPSNR